MSEKYPRIGIILDPVIVSSSTRSPRVNEFKSQLENQGLIVFDSASDAILHGKLDLLSITGSIRALREFGRNNQLRNTPCFDMFTPELHYYSHYQYQIPQAMKLNSEGVALPFSECERMSYEELCQRIGLSPEGDVFMRPDPALKVCEAQVLNEIAWESWKSYTKKYTGVSSSTFLWWFPSVEIQKEYRCFMMKGKCVSVSEYGFESEASNRDGEAELVQFAESAAQHIELDDPCYVIDLAQTNNGLKVIELNCASTAGLYELDLARVASAWSEGLKYVYSDRY